MPNHLVWIQF